MPSAPGLVGPRHLWRWLGAALVACFGLLAVNSPRVLDSRINPEVPLSPPRLVHNATVIGDKVQVGPNLGPHAEVDWDTAIAPHRRFLIAMKLDNPGEYLSPRVHVDLYAPGYDNREQSFLLTVPSSARGYPVLEIADSGAAPRAVSLRVFHFDPYARVAVGSVKLRRISVAYDALRILLMVGIAVALAGLCACCAAALREHRAASGQGPSSMGEWWLLSALVSVLVVAVCNALLGAPQIFADEYIYRASVAALHTGDWAGLREAHYQDMPNRLFFAAYGLTAIAKHPFAAARVVDALWLIAGWIPLFLLSRACGVPAAGLFVGVAWALGPVGSYSAYFTPEVMFATTFTLGCVLAAFAIESRSLHLGIASAGTFAALAYVKPNGWVPAAAMALFAVAQGLRDGSGHRRRFVLGTLAALVAFGAAWAGLGLALPRAPFEVRSLGMYGGVGLRALRALATPEMLPLVARFLLIHLAIVACLAGPALAYGLHALVRPRSGADASRRERLARIVTASGTLVLLALVAMTAVFSASIAGRNAADTAIRLHSRYYGFALPLVVIGFVASPAAREWSGRAKTLVVLLWAAASLAAALALPKFQWSAFDSPDLFVVGVVPAWTIGMFGLAGAASALASLRRKAQALQLATLIAYVAVAIGAGVAVRSFQFDWTLNSVDRAGRFAEALAEEAGSTIVAVADPAHPSSWIYRLAAYAPARTRFTTADQTAAAVAAGLPAGALLVGEPKDLPRAGVTPLARFGALDIVRVADAAKVAAGAGSSVLQPGRSLVLSFAGAGTQGIRISGMHAAEAWGAWSAAPEIAIDLPLELRGNLRLALEARALGPNVGRPLTLAVGSQSRTFTLTDALKTVDLDIAVPEPERRITISGIEPVAAQSLGLPHDDRVLGIGIASLRIAATEQAVRR